MFSAMTFDGLIVELRSQLEGAILSKSFFSKPTLNLTVVNEILTRFIDALIGLSDAERPMPFAVKDALLEDKRKPFGVMCLYNNNYGEMLQKHLVRYYHALEVYKAQRNTQDPLLQEYLRMLKQGHITVRESDIVAFRAMVATSSTNLAHIKANLTQFTAFFATADEAQCAAALTYLQSDAGIASLATENGYKDFLMQNAIALHQQCISIIEGRAIAEVSEVARVARPATPPVSGGGGGEYTMTDADWEALEPSVSADTATDALKVAEGEAMPSSSGAAPIHGVAAGRWYHNKASDRDMQWSGLWDEVIRYSTGATSDAERQRGLAIETAQALNRLAIQPSAEVPASFGELLRGVLAAQAAKSNGAGASDKTDGVKAIVIDREGEVVADDYPELHARFNALSEPELTNICRNLNRMQEDLRAENANQPFRQAFTRAFLALPSSIEKLTRINGYERYKVRESKAETLYGEYRRILNPPTTDALPPRFFDTLTHLETGSVLEQNGTLHQLGINLRQFSAFLQKETTPEDQRHFVQEYLQRETVISTLAHSSSFAHFQAALLVRPTAPPKSAMHPEPAAVFAPVAAPIEAASAPPLPANVTSQPDLIPPTPLGFGEAEKGGSPPQGAFSFADAQKMPEAPVGQLPAASAPPLPVGVKREAVKEPVLG